MASKPGWDEYFLDMLEPLSRRSSCTRRRVSALIVVDNRIISTGYNGTPRGTVNCNEGGCPRCQDAQDPGVDLGECVCSHAEENAIVQCAYNGISCRGGTLYTQWLPCIMCTKMIINSGIKLIVYEELYHENQYLVRDLLATADVPFIRSKDYGRSRQA